MNCRVPKCFLLTEFAENVSADLGEGDGLVLFETSVASELKAKHKISSFILLLILIFRQNLKGFVHYVSRLLETEQNFLFLSLIDYKAKLKIQFLKNRFLRGIYVNVFLTYLKFG